jgi:hypothetical protein
MANVSNVAKVPASPVKIEEDFAKNANVLQSAASTTRWALISGGGE